MSKSKQDLNIQIPESILQELLTDSEVRMIKRRLTIIKLLQEGLSIRAIAEKARVGTDTVVRISKKIKTSPNLKSFFQKSPILSKNSKWTFGESSTD